MMYERFSPEARSAIKSARARASVLGHTAVETEDLLFGLVRQEPDMIRQWAANDDVLKKRIAAMSAGHSYLLETSEPDIGINHACKRALAYAGEEAERARCSHITLASLWLGLLREDQGRAH